MSIPLNHLGMAELARMIRAGEVTAEAVMQSCLERIEHRESEVGAFVCIDQDGAMQTAHRVDQSESKGLSWMLTVTD